MYSATLMVLYLKYIWSKYTSPLTSGENSTILMYLNEKDPKVYLK